MSKRTLDSTDADYWESDGGTVYAYLGPLNGDVMFRLSGPGDSQEDWEWLDPRGSVWSAAHQAMYRNLRWDPLTPERITELPLLPEELPAKQFAEALRGPEPILASTFPLLADQIRTGPASGLPIFAVLSEDPYETSLGDGKFAYLHEVFLDPAEANAECVRMTGCGHLRRMAVTLEGEHIVVVDQESEWFDEVTIMELIERLEKQLVTPPGGNRSPP